MNIENKNPEDLVGKYLAGEATPEEAMLLDEWLAEPGNQKEFDRLMKIWNHLPGTPVQKIPAMRQSWSELEVSIAPVHRSRLARIFLNRYATAACIAGLMVIVSIFWFKKSGHPGIDAGKDVDYITKAAVSGIRTDTIPDGSVVTINNNSSITYHQSFGKTNRDLTLKGEAYFHVIPDQEKPFIISIDELKIRVVGTSFNVNKLPSGEAIEVLVQSGIVKMYTATKEITITKGKTGIYTRSDGDLKLKDTLDINSMGYATKTFLFNDISFAGVCHYLERAFDVKIEMDAHQFEGCRLTAQFDNNSLNYILDVISATLNTHYKQTGNTIYITGNGCQ